MENIIFYGAGQYARTMLSLWERAGLIPACFADADESKQNSKFEDKYDILSLADALVKYPDYQIYISLVPEKWNAIHKYLLGNGIAKEKIHAHDGVQEYEWRLGCEQLGTFMKAQQSIVQLCYLRKQVAFESSCDLRADYAQWREEATNLIDSLRKGNPASCEGCRALREGFFPSEVRLHILQIGGRWPGSRCNFRCKYCGYETTADNWRRRKGFPHDPAEGERTPVDLLRELKPVVDEENIDILIVSTAGEFLCTPFVDEIIALLKEYGWNSCLFTNGSIYKENFAELIRGTNVALNVSLDSGTRETFKKIKGVDSYNRVIENLKRYHNAGAKIDLKYIILEGINDNAADIDGFVEAARQLDAHVQLSSDFNKTTQLSNHTIEMVNYLIYSCKKALGGIQRVVCDDVFIESEIPGIDMAIASETSF